MAAFRNSGHSSKAVFWGRLPDDALICESAVDGDVGIDAFQAIAKVDPCSRGAAWAGLSVRPERLAERFKVWVYRVSCLENANIALGDNIDERRRKLRCALADHTPREDAGSALGKTFGQHLPPQPVYELATRSSLQGIVFNLLVHSRSVLQF
jgi:hypothetical protein